MDVNGAKALKERLSLNGKGEAEPAPAEADIAEDAPPVYHWVGIAQTAPGTPAAEHDPAPRASIFRRLGLSFR